MKLLERLETPLLHHVTSKAVFSGDFYHAREMVDSLERFQLCDSVGWDKTVTPNEVAVPKTLWDL